MCCTYLAQSTHLFIVSLEEKGFKRTRPCRDKPRLAKCDGLGQDTGRSHLQGNLIRSCTRQLEYVPLYAERPGRGAPGDVRDRLKYVRQARQITSQTCDSCWHHHVECPVGGAACMVQQMAGTCPLLQLQLLQLELLQLRHTLSSDALATRTGGSQWCLMKRGN